MKPALRLSVASWTDNWSPKFLNQDTVFTFVRPPELGGVRALLIVADGMGSKFPGKVSSLLATSVIHHSLRVLLEGDDSQSSVAWPIPESATPERHLEARLRMALEAANEAIYEHWQQVNSDANGASAAACALVYNQLAAIANVGDCRAYHLRGHDLQQVTPDHTLVNELTRRGELSAQEARLHPYRSVLTSALGTEAEVRRVDTGTIPLEAGDQLLLCSDGLYRALEDNLLKRCLLNASRPDIVARSLVNAAKEAGGSDDISVIVAKVMATAPQ
jgi:serine/threonine protein phosphatase PrpC